MFRKIAFAGLGIALLASPLITSADTISDIQAKVRELVAQVQQLKAQLASSSETPSNSAGGGVGIVAPAARICPQILRTLDQGITGSDVKDLQAYLGVSQTGYFGPMTARAVSEFQADEGLTQVGVVGPQTRAAFARRCGWNNNGNFFASPTSGKAPLTINFWSVIGNGTTDGYSVDFGDGTTGNTSVGCAINPLSGTNACPRGITASHTYTQNGTYVAKLMYQEPFICNAPPGAACMTVMAQPKVVGTVVIKVGSVAPSCPVYSPPLCNENEQLVGGGIGSDGCQLSPRCVPKTPTTPGAPSISGIEGPAAIAAGATGMWTVHASVPNNTNTQLRYSVIWGDEGVLDQIRAFGATSATNLQTSGSFTHAYARAGTFRPTFTVSNTFGSAQAGISVVVGGSDGGGTICPVVARVCLPGQRDQVDASCVHTCVPDTSGGTDAFSASPTSGAAPLTVIFRSNIVNNLDSYSISFGDGTNGTLQNNCSLGFGACGLPTSSHTYTVNGTYTAQLIKGVDGCAGWTSSIACTRPVSREVVGTVVITVGGGTTSNGTFTATPKTGAPPLMVTFTGVGNTISFGDDGPTLIAANNGSLGTVTHVYRGGGEYTAVSDGRSVTISVVPNRFDASIGSYGFSSLCVYNNRTYQSGTSVDVPTKICSRGASFSGAICDKLTIAGDQVSVTPQRYSCSNGQWFDPNNAPLEGELVNATSCLAADGTTAVASGQLIAQGAGAIAAFDLYSIYGKRLPTTMKCSNGSWLNCDAYGNNCTQASAGTNTNLASALTAVESALKAIMTLMGR